MRISQRLSGVAGLVIAVLAMLGGASVKQDCYVADFEPICVYTDNCGLGQAMICPDGTVCDHNLLWNDDLWMCDTVAPPDGNDTCRNGSSEMCVFELYTCVPAQGGGYDCELAPDYLKDCSEDHYYPFGDPCE